MSHQSRVEWQHHLPQPAGHASLDAAQDMVGTLQGHVELLVNQHTQVLLLRASLILFSAQPVFVLEVALTHMQDLALGLVDLYEICMGPPLKPVQLLLDGMHSLQYVDCTTQLVSSADLLRVRSIPLSMLLTKMLNSTGRNIDT